MLYFETLLVQGSNVLFVRPIFWSDLASPLIQGELPFFTKVLRVIKQIVKTNFPSRFSCDNKHKKIFLIETGMQESIPILMHYISQSFRSLQDPKFIKFL